MSTSPTGASPMSAPAMIRFGGGLPDASCLPDLSDLFQQALRKEPESLGYDQAHLHGGGVWGYEPLRAAIAARLSARSGSSLGTENVVLANGAAGALNLLASQLVDPGTVVAVEELTYPTAAKIFRDRGAKIVTVPLDDDGLQVDALARYYEGPEADRPSLLYTIMSAQSPTGTNLSLDRRQELASLAKATGLMVIQDDTYGEIAFDGDPRLMLGFAPRHTVHVGSFSKTLAPGLRSGWIASNTELCQTIAKERTDLGQTTVVQHVIAQLFEQGRFERHLAEVTDVYRAKRDALAEGLATYCGDSLQWKLPPAGFFLWATLHEGDVRDVIRAGEDLGVSPLGGPHFSVGEPNLTGMRLAFSEIPVEDLPEGARRISVAIHQTR